jgi:hypothetical protein
VSAVDLIRGEAEALVGDAAKEGDENSRSSPLPPGTLQGPADRGLYVLPGEQAARPDPYPVSLEDGLGHPGDPEQSHVCCIGSGHLRTLGHDPGSFVGDLERSWRRLAGKGSGRPSSCLDGPRYPIPRRLGVATGV